MTERSICPDDHPHDATQNCYVRHRCGCTPCRAHASAETLRRNRARTYGRWQEVYVPATGTRRRLQALQAIGWSQSRIAEQLGLRPHSLWRWTALAERTVARATHDRVAALYEQLWNQLPPHDDWRTLYSYNRTRNRAAAEGWLPPAAWDDIDTDPEPPAVDRDPDYVDDAAVELATAGIQVPLTAAERCAAVTLLHRRRLNDHEIAALLHLAPRTVLRIRERLELPAAVGADRQPIYDTSRRDAA